MIAVSMSGRASGIKAEHRTARPSSKRNPPHEPAFSVAGLFRADLSCPPSAWRAGRGDRLGATGRDLGRAARSAPAGSRRLAELTPAEAQRALSVLQDPRQRARLIETLQTIAKAAGQVPAEAAPATEAKAAAEPTARRQRKPRNRSRSRWSRTVSRRSLCPGLPAGRGGSSRTRPRRCAPCPICICCGIGSRGWSMTGRSVCSRLMSPGSLLWCSASPCCWSALCAFALRRPAARLAASAPDPAEAAAADNGAWHRLRRLPAAAARLGLKLVPVAIFWTAATLLAGFVPVPLTRMAICDRVNAYTAIRVMLAIGRMLLAPRGERLAPAAYR